MGGGGSMKFFKKLSVLIKLLKLILKLQVEIEHFDINNLTA